MIQVKNIHKEFAGEVVLDEVSFTVGARERIGLVGRNGSGKSTLFKIILGELRPDSGEVAVPKQYKIGSLSQHLKFDKDTILEDCATALPESQRFDHFRAEKILFGLGFTQEDMQRSPHEFSGGYQVRLNLAKALLGEPQMLLLDEPTNYLDIISLRWLRQFLRSFDGEVIIITHDRDFMDSVTTHTMGIVRKGLRKIKGNTRHFYEQIEQDEIIYEQTRQNQEKKIKEMEGFVERFRAQASKASQAQSRLKQLEKMDNLEKLESEKDLSFRFHYKECPGKYIMKVHDLGFGYQEDQRLFKELNFALQRNERIGVIGKNGKGKSTLLNVLAGVLKPQEGEIEFHPSMLLGHFGQTNVERLSPKNTIVDEVRAVNPKLGHSQVRGICGSMMFEGDQADKQISVLSGGEKSRVLLGKILARPSNLLFLDEPTNHLDMQSIDSLIEALEEYKGAVMMVTHSEEMLRRVATNLIIFRRDGAQFFHGGYDDFLRRVGWDEEGEGAKKAPKKKAVKDKHKPKKKDNSVKLKPLKEKRDQMEELIMKFEEMLDKKNQEMEKISGSPEKILECSRSIGETQKQIDALFDKLEKIDNEIQQLES